MTGYAGDYSFGHTLIPLPFPTHKGDGTPITLAGTPTVTVYKDNTTTKSTSGVTLTVDLDGVTGSHVVKIDTSSDAAFYAAGHDFVAKLSAGTVDGISVVGYIVGSFSIENRSGLRPTVAGRTLDVAATGEAGVDLTNKLDTTGILPNAQAGAASGLALVGSAMEVATKTGFSLATSPPTAAQIREEIDTYSTQLAAIAASGSDPVGSVTWLYTVTDSVTHAVIAGATVEVYSDAACTALVQSAITNSSGVATFRLLPGTYYILSFAPGYDDPIADTEVVT